MTYIKKIRKYLHYNNDEFEELWDYDAEQQNVAAYWLYEVPIDLEVDMVTGSAYITHVCGVELKEKVKA